MTDPWTLHRNLACPSCHVVGKVVQTEDYDPDPPFICVECGSSWHDGGVYADQSLKECRIQYGRLIEGRPYDEPAVEFKAPTAASSATIEWMDRLLREVYKDSPNGVAVIVGNNVPSTRDGYMLDTGAWKLESYEDE